MKATFTNTELLKGVQAVFNSVGHASLMPILANVKIEVKDDSADICGTDLEQFALVGVPCETSKTGSITVPARMLLDILKRTDSLAGIEIETKGHNLVIRAGSDRYQLATLPVDDYPEWPNHEAQSSFNVSAHALKQAATNTLFACPTKDPRKVLMGVYFTGVIDGDLTLVATDGRKMGKAKVDIIPQFGVDISHIVPASFLRNALPNFADSEEITVQFSGRNVVFSSGGRQYLSSLIEGKFPQYNAVIPDRFEKAIQLPIKKLQLAISRAAVLAEKKFNSIICEFGAGRIDITAQDAESGAFEGQVDIDYDGEPFKIAFSHQYLAEVLKLVPGDFVTMKVKDSVSPVVLTSDGLTQTLFLIMPVRMHDIENAEEEDAA